MRGNRGEWSEFYTLIKLLGDGKLYDTDSTMSRKHSFYTILSAMREGFRYDRDAESDCVVVKKEATGETLSVIPFIDIQKATKDLYQEIKVAKGATFELSDMNHLIRELCFGKLKDRAATRSNIDLLISDAKAGVVEKRGFSIRSRLGASATLMNAAGSTTNFIYKITGRNLTDDEFNRINTYSSIKDQVYVLSSWGCGLQFVKMENDTFKSNLQVIDSNLPLIFSEIIKLYYGGVATSMTDLVGHLESKNPCGFNLAQGQPYYTNIIKSLLEDTALGMMPNVRWTGRYTVTGGHIIVTEFGGEVLCHPIDDRDAFQKYLLGITKLDTPKKTRHRYANLYKERGEIFIKLNFQIRFK